MSEQNQSRFALNLSTQFVLAFVCTVSASMSPDIPRVILSTLGSIFWLTFSFGLFYAFFRLIGVRSSGLESFYQSFPFGSHAKISNEALPQNVAPMPPSPPFNWHKLFSFQFLRFAGVLLIITSVFSLLFNIHWELLYKIIATVVSGLILLGGAEWLRTRKGSVSPFLSILAFAMLQFSLSLSYQYATQNNWSALFLAADTWLYCKIALTVIMLWTMTRYPTAWMPLLYVLVGWFSATSLTYVDGTLTSLASAIFIVALSAITLGTGNVLRKPELILVNGFLAYFSMGWQLLPQAMTMRYLVLFLIIGVFAAQLFASVLLSGKEKGEKTLHIANTVFSHIFLLIGIQSMRAFFPIVDQYIGVTFLLLANITLCAYLVGKKLQSNTTFTDVLFNAAVILASVGLFVQVTGPWSSVIFLAYSTAVLWLSLYRQNIRTRVYGCILLLVSIIKLYFEFGGIFDRIWGCVAILIIGLLLVVLSYKFEAIKDVMLHGMNEKNN